MLVAMGVFLICFVWAVKTAGKGIAVAGLVLLIITLGTELLVLLELSGSSPDLTYGSDARYYYEAALAVLENKKTILDFSAPLYVAWEVFVLQSSPSTSFVYVLFANTLLFVAAYFCQVVVLLDRVKNILFFQGVKERTFCLEFGCMDKRDSALDSCSRLKGGADLIYHFFLLGFAL
jgi:hypothetical protein